MLFDTHSHLNAEQFEEDLEEVSREGRSGSYKYGCGWI